MFSYRIQRKYIEEWITIIGNKIKSYLNERIKSEYIEDNLSLSSP